MLDLFADLTGLTTVLTRIADALDRIAGPPHVISERSEPGRDSVAASGSGPSAPSFAESPEEYAARQSWESQMALDLGFAPHAPQVEELLRQMRDDLMNTRTTMDTTDAEGNASTTAVEAPALTEPEAIQAIRDAFQAAIAQTNTR